MGSQADRKTLMMLPLFLMNIYSDYLESLRGKILLGCDGFVDETYEIVEERTSPSAFTTVRNLKDFGQLIVDRDGGAVGVEIVPKRRCEGGFGINSGRIAAGLGLKPVLPGLYGGNSIDPAFAPFEDSCELISLGDPALTLAFEFSNGKLLMSDLAAVSNLKWADVVDRLGEAKIKTLFTDVDILGLGYWSLTSNFDDLFAGFMAQYETLTPPRRMFFDFADLKKKSPESFRHTLDLIRAHNDRIPMSLSLNHHEVMELCVRMGVDCPEATPALIEKALPEARAKIGFDELIVHTPDFAAAAHATDGVAVAQQAHQTKVVRLAGAGDSFNGGYMCASLGDLPLKQRLVMANAATAFFVTHGAGPTPAQLLEQIDQAADK